MNWVRAVCSYDSEFLFTKLDIQNIEELSPTKAMIEIPMRSFIILYRNQLYYRRIMQVWTKHNLWTLL